MGNQAGKKNVKSGSIVEDQVKDDSSESYEEGTCVDNDMVALISKPTPESPATADIDINKDVNGDDTCMSGLPGETVCQDTVPDNTAPTDNNHIVTHTPEPDHHDNRSDDEKERKSHISKLPVAEPGDNIELQREAVRYDKIEPGSRSDMDPVQEVPVFHEHVNINMTVPHVGRETSNNLLDRTSQSVLTEYSIPSPVDPFAINENAAEEKEKLDTNHNLTIHYGSICYDATSQYKKRITSDEVDNRCTYIETDSGGNCDSVRPKIYSNVIFLPDKSKGASPKRFGPKRLGSKFDGMKFDSESDVENKLKNDNTCIKDDSSKETIQDRVLSELSGNLETNVPHERSKGGDQIEADISNGQTYNNGADEDKVRTNTGLQFSEDHFGLYTGCEASGITQVNTHESVANVPNEQSVTQSGPFSVTEQLETAPESRHRSPESTSSQLSVSRNENYPAVQNNEQHGINVTTPCIKAPTENPEVQKLVDTIPENEPIEACAICNLLRDECLCLFPKPVFKTVMTLSRYEHSKPVLSYFRHLKFGEKSVDWSNLKSAQAKYAMGLRSLKTSLPDDNRLMLEFKLPPNKGFNNELTESDNLELRLTLEKNVAFNEDKELTEFLESRMNLNGVSMSDSFNSNRYVMINDFDDDSGEEVPSSEEDDLVGNGNLDKTVISGADFEEKTDETFENCVVFDNVLNDRPDNIDDFTERENIPGDKNLEKVELANKHDVCFTSTSSSSESTVDDQEPCINDSPESPVERNQSVTENTVDNFLCPDNTVEDALILNDIQQPNENIENSESVNAAMLNNWNQNAAMLNNGNKNDAMLNNGNQNALILNNGNQNVAILNNGNQILSEDLSNRSSGAIKENTVSEKVNPSLKRSKTKPEDDNRLQQLNDDEDIVIDSTSGVNNEIELVPEDEHSDALRTLDTGAETEIKGDGIHFPFLQDDLFDSSSLDYTLPPDQFLEQLRRRAEHAHGLDFTLPSEQFREQLRSLNERREPTRLDSLISRLGSHQRAPYRPPTATSSFAASFYECDDHRVQLSELGNKNKNLGDQQANDTLHGRRSRFLERFGLSHSNRSSSSSDLASHLPSGSDVHSRSSARPHSPPRSSVRPPSPPRSSSPRSNVHSRSPTRPPPLSSSPSRSPPPPVSTSRSPSPRSDLLLRSPTGPPSPQMPPSPPRSFSPPRSSFPEPSIMLSSPPEATTMSRSPPSTAEQKEEESDVNEDKDDSSVDDNDDLGEIWTKMLEESIKLKEVHKSLPKCRFTVLCVDTSKSMEGLPWQHVKDFVPKFLSGLEEVRHEHGIQECVAMVTFGHDTKISCHLTDNYQQIINSLDTIQPSGCSPLIVGLLLSLACIGFTAGGDLLTLRLHDIDVSHRIILLSDGYPTPSKRPSDPEEISDSKSLKAITQINELFDDNDVRGTHICCISLGDNTNRCVLELLCEVSKGRLFDHTEIGAVSRSTHNHYISAQISHQMFNMPDIDGLDVDMFASMAKELYPDTSTEDLSEMEKLAHDAYARLATERSGILTDLDSDSDSASDTVNDNFEPQCLDNLPSIGTRVTMGPDLSNFDEMKSDIGTITGHSHSKKGKVFVQWDSGTEMLCCYGYQDEWEILLNETEEIFHVDDEIKPGNKVRRGPDWSYGNDDGGSDQVGAVYNVCTDGVVWVRWPNGNRGNYRYNQDGMFDVLKSDPVDPTGEESFVALMNERNKAQDEV